MKNSTIVYLKDMMVTEFGLTSFLFLHKVILQLENTCTLVTISRKIKILKCALKASTYFY